MRPSQILLALCFCAVFAVCVLGQKPPSATKPDNAKEAFVYERVRDALRFEDDGTGIEDSTAVVRVQSQAGIEALGQLVFGYSSATDSLEIDYVRVRKPDGRVIETPASTAQDFAPDILKEAPMYSDFRQRHVTVASLQVGDVLEYHSITHMKPLAEGQFWYEHSFLKSSPAQEQTLEIDLPRAREIKLKSPNHKYETREAGERRIYTWTIKDFAPRKDNEDSDEEDDGDSGPDVQLSTFTDWQQIAHWYAKLQGERAAVDDSIRKTADELTRGAKTPTEKASRLYDYVARNIRYVSLSFGVGRLQPHQASEVLKNGYGDCKDKHTLLEALLGAEGITSYPVLINSERKLDDEIPSPAQFDHVITAAQVEKGTNLTWLDATAEVAPYGMILYPLRNKQALLAADGASAGLRRTPATSPVENRMVMKIDGKFTELGALDATIDMTAQGDSDFPMRAVLRRVSQANWERVLKYMSATWGLGGDVSDVHIDSLEDTSKPFHMTYHLHQDNYFSIPSTNTTFEVLPAVGGGRLNGGKKASEPLDVGPSTERIYKAHMEFAPNFTVHVPQETRMVRDYGEYSSSYVLTKNILDAERRMVLKVNELPATRRSDYESFRTVTSGGSTQRGLWCSIAPASAAAVAAAAHVTGTPEEIRKAGSAALERRDYSVAADLLKRSLDQDPKQKGAWEELGLAYAGLNQHDQAIGAFRKQIEMEPSNTRANSDLAAEFEQQGKLDDAVAAYKKQMEITPGEKLVHKNLGLLLAQMKHDEEARTELETAASIPPSDPQVRIALAQVYARAGNSEKAQALMKSVLGVTVAANGADLFTPALSDNMDANEALHDARQTLDDLGDQFDAGEYDHLNPSAFSAMNLVALSWARIGWAKFMQHETLEAMQFLNAAWMLSQSGTVANRLARIYQKENQPEKARHLFALAAAAGGEESQASHDQLLKLSASPADAEKAMTQATAELVQMRTLALPAVASNGSASFALVFNGSSKPERAEYLEGDSALHSAADKLREKEYPVRFPDVTSVKIIRRAAVSCTGSGCAVVLQPLDKWQ
jgi:Flp pilus assembly protein TadD